MSNLSKHMLQLVGIAKGWATKTLPGWCDETHRDLLARHGAKAVDGRVSASTLGLIELAAVLDDYERRGWPRQREFAGQGKPTPVPARISHMVRLWGRLGQAGKVKDASRANLLIFCLRQSGRRELTDLDALSRSECQSITEALKAWLSRPAD